MHTLLRPFALALLTFAACGGSEPSDGCVEGTASRLEVTIAGLDEPFHDVSTSELGGGRARLDFDPLIGFEGATRKSMQATDGPLRYRLCDHGLVVHYPRRGTGEPDAPIRSPVTFYLALAGVQAFQAYDDE